MWEGAELKLSGAMAYLSEMLNLLPEDVAHTATRNRIVMAMDKLDEARDMLAAAKDRLPK